MSKAAIAIALTMIGSSAAANIRDDRVLARALVSKENWQAAVAAYRAIVEVDPLHGSDWYFLGESLSRLGNCTEARPFLERAIALGVDGGRAGLRRGHVAAAKCAAATGHTDNALEHLSIAQARYGFDGFEGLAAAPPFAALKDDPGFRRLAGQPQPKLDRIAAWRADLDHYADLVRRRHPNPYHNTAQSTWLGAVADLRRHIRTLDDVAVVGGFMHLASLIGDGHTSIIPPLEGPMAFHLLPIWPYRLGDDWHIVAATPEHRNLVGSRIVSIEGRPISEIVQRMRGLLPADNDMTLGYIGVTALQFSEIATLAADARSTDALALTVRDQTGRLRNVTLRGTPIDRDPTTAWAPRSWPTMASESVPLWLAHPDEPHIVHALDNGQTIYAQINRIADGPEQSFAQFAEDLGKRILDARVRRLVVDLRHNNGGSGSLNWTLVREIVRAARLDREDGLFVITGPRTFSAAMNLASMLETHSHAIFVGEPTGSRPNFFGEDTPFTLPNSRLTGSISSAWFQGGATSDDLRPFISPDLPAPLSADDLRAGRDPAMRAINAYIASHPPAPES